MFVYTVVILDFTSISINTHCDTLIEHHKTKEHIAAHSYGQKLQIKPDLTAER